MQHLFRVLAGLAIMLITGLVFIAFHWFAPKAAWANALTALLVCYACLLYTSPSPRDKRQSRMPSSA